MPEEAEETEEGGPKKDKEEAEELEGEAEGASGSRRKFYLASVDVLEFIERSAEEIFLIRGNLEKASAPKTPKHPLTRHLASLLREITTDLPGLLKKEDGEDQPQERRRPKEEKRRGGPRRRGGRRVRTRSRRKTSSRSSRKI